MKSNVSEPLMKCRKSHSDDVETGASWCPRDQQRGDLYLASAASGIQAARAWIRLGHGTLEPVAPMRREKSKRRTRKGERTDAGHRGGTTRSSVERRVTRPERRGRVIVLLGTRSTVSTGGTHD